MPKFTVKANKQLIKAKLKRIRNKIKKKFKAAAEKKLGKIMRKEIIDKHILKGKSPVRGEGRFAKYSDSYKKQIRNPKGILKASGKKIRPVNLRVSGELLASFKITATAQGLKFGFKDKISAYHQEGTDKMPQRKMLPDASSNEKFTYAISRAYNKEAVKIMKNIVRIQKVKIK